MRASTRKSTGLWQRIRLRDSNGGIVLDRWGLAVDRVGGVLLHYMNAPDPGVDLHDHPWDFFSIVLWGHYDEWRIDTRIAPQMADIAKGVDHYDVCTPGVEEHRGWLSVKRLRLDEAHKTVRISRFGCVSLCFRGPRRRSWGFYTPSGYIDERTYENTHQRDVYNEIGT